MSTSARPLTAVLGLFALSGGSSTSLAASTPLAQASSTVAIVLILVGAGLLIGEAFATSGWLGAVGLLTVGLGALLLAEPSLRPPLWAVVPTAAVVVATTGYVAWRATKIRRLRQLTGAEGLITESGTAATEVTRSGGDVVIHGEHWRAVATRPIPKGAPVKVRRVEGLTLFVEQEPSWTT